MLNEKQVAKLIEPILNKALGSLGLANLATRAAPDHDGEAAIFVDALYKPSAPKFDAKIFLNAVNEAMRALADNGDDRFIYVRNFYSDGEPALEDYAPRIRRKGKAA